MTDAGRFEPFSEQERAILAFGMALLFMDLALGLVSGSPAPAEVLARDLPVIRRMMDELGSAYGERLDPDLMAQMVAKLDQDAAAERGDA